MKTTFLTAAALTLALHPAFAQVETTPPPPAAPRQLQIPKPAEKTRTQSAASCLEQHSSA